MAVSQSKQNGTRMRVQCNFETIIYQIPRSRPNRLLANTHWHSRSHAIQSKALNKIDVFNQKCDLHLRSRTRHSKVMGGQPMHDAPPLHNTLAAMSVFPQLDIIPLGVIPPSRPRTDEENCLPGSDL